MRGMIKVTASAPSADGPAIEDRRLVRLYRYWMERKGARRFPSRHDIDPLHFPYVLD